MPRAPPTRGAVKASVLIAIAAVVVAGLLHASGLKPWPGRPLWPFARGGGVTVYQNATFWTGEEYAAAMVVRPDGRIGRVGPAAEVLRWAGAGARAVDLQGRRVIPGLHDPHTHILKGGLALGSADLSAVDSVDAFKAAVAAACDRPTVGEWVVAMGWDEAAWGGQQPSKVWLDAACGRRPVLLLRACAHKVLLNSRAAELAGVGRGTPDPPGGCIHRDESGDFTGLLSENAVPLATGRLPRPSAEEQRRLILQAARHLASQGVTTAHDMGDVPLNADAAFETLEVYSRLADAGELPIRLFAFTPLSAWQRLAARVAAHGSAHASGRLFCGGLKEFADGSLGSGTALLHQPYADDPTTAGIRTIEQPELQRLIAGAHAAGLQVAVHAIGDLALDSVLQAFANATASLPSNPAAEAPRHRIEHAQHLAGPQAAARLAAAGVRVVANPLHLLPDRRVLRQRLGAARAGAGRSYALRTMLQAGVRVAFGSDWPVVKPQPLLGVFAAAFRRAPGDSQPFVAEEGISLEQALRASTAEAAALAGLEAELGSLRAGMHADFVVLDADPLAMRPDGPLPAVLQTFVGGLCVFGCEASL